MRKFYGYESHKTSYLGRRIRNITIEHDVSTTVYKEDEDGRTRQCIGPAGRLRVFSSIKARDAWVKQGPTMVQDHYGNVTAYRIRSACTAVQAKRSNLTVTEFYDTTWEES